MRRAREAGRRDGPSGRPRFKSYADSSSSDDEPDATTRPAKRARAASAEDSDDDVVKRSTPFGFASLFLAGFYAFLALFFAFRDGS
jgi:hypothetical protein